MRSQSKKAIPPCLRVPTSQSAGEHLAEAAQSSNSAKLASRDPAKALGSPQLLQHKDKVGGRRGGYGGRCLGALTAGAPAF